jgi:alpha-tubulin suppressor-like RCC1 family protein
VPGLAGIIYVAAGEWHSLAATYDGQVWACGNSNSGSLGDGTFETRLRPVQISEPDFVWKTGTPILGFNSGTYSPTNTLDVPVSSASPGATVRYTLDGTEPSTISTLVPADNIVRLDRSATFKAKAWSSGAPPSNSDSAIYELKVAPPFTSPAPSTFPYGTSITVTSPTSGSVVRYRTDGSTPTDADPQVTSGGSIVLQDTIALALKASRDGWTSAVVTGMSYVVRAPAPILTPAEALFSGAGQVTIASSTPGVTLRYSISGIDPVASDPVVTSGGSVTVGESMTLKARAFHPNWAAGDVAIGAYFVQLTGLATPTMTPAPGVYASATPVTLSCTTPGVTLRYTTDGTEPGLQSPVYTGPITIDSNTTLKAKAFKTDYIPSSTASGSYQINTGGTATPTFRPNPGFYATTRRVVVTCTTPGAVIHYTTDGKEPTESDPVVPSGSELLVDRSVRLKAKAWTSGLNASATRSGDYWITGAVSGGKSHSIALRSNGQVMSWGSDSAGQLGNGSGGSSTAPVPVNGISDVVAVSAGTEHTLALKSDGTVWAWGGNASGQLGNGTTGSSHVPVPVGGLFDVVAVAAGSTYYTDTYYAVGGSHSLALKSDGTVWAWGDNTLGQLGDGSTTRRLSPIMVPGLSGVVRIDAGHGFSIALKTDGMTSGSIWAWGMDDHAQLGDQVVAPTPAFRARPALGPSGMIDLAAGRNHAVGIKSDRNAWFWGDFVVYDPLSFGFFVIWNHPTPFQVPDVPPAIGIVAGASFDLTLSSDRTVVGWGETVHTPNGSGDIGNRVESLVEIVALGAGDAHALAVRADGTVWTWGFNLEGQLGYEPWSAELPMLDAQQVPGLSLVDNANDDPDADGLSTMAELVLGTDPYDADSNDDGLLDGAAVSSGTSPTNPDVDGDGVPNGLELVRGTSPFNADTDGDGVRDDVDAFPLDPTRWQAPPPNPTDQTPPTIVLREPPGAVPH